MITADTITDEQIRELMRERVSPDLTRVALCVPASHMGRAAFEAHRAARARCVEILNARAASGGERMWDPIKRGGVRMVKCRKCGDEFFEMDDELTSAHERGHSVASKDGAK